MMQNPCKSADELPWRWKTCHLQTAVAVVFPKGNPTYIINVDYPQVNLQPKRETVTCPAQVPGYKMVNMLPSGKTPFLRLGYEEDDIHLKMGKLKGQPDLVAANLVDSQPGNRRSSQHVPTQIRWLSHQRQIQGATKCCMTWALPSLPIP